MATWLPKLKCKPSSLTANFGVRGLACALSESRRRLVVRYLPHYEVGGDKGGVIDCGVRCPHLTRVGVLQGVLTLQNKFL
jgi:hypothetical protein